ncbi:MAG: DUF5946 family protein [Chthoniobacterales bacterium]
MANARVRCVGCGGMFPEIAGPTHRYMESSPGCWAAYGEVIARQYTDVNYAAAGQLIVDAYAVQHPGRPSPQSIQSVALHLIGLCLVLERGVSARATTAMIQTAAKDKQKFVWLTPPPSMGPLTVVEVAAATSAVEHVARVRAWAASAWEAWKQHHVRVSGWLDSAELGMARPTG